MKEINKVIIGELTLSGESINKIDTPKESKPFWEIYLRDGWMIQTTEPVFVWFKPTNTDNVLPSTSGLS